VRKYLSLAVLAAAVWIVALAAREYWLGSRAMRASDTAIRLGDLRFSAIQARKAAECSLPGSPFPALARTRLGEIALNAELRSDYRVAVAAVTHLRSANDATELPFQNAQKTDHKLTSELGRLDGLRRTAERTAQLKADADQILRHDSPRFQAETAQASPAIEGSARAAVGIALFLVVLVAFSLGRPSLRPPKLDQTVVSSEVA
jgi:hypothetical protein